MSEWGSVLAVFWALWAIDGMRLGPQAIFFALPWGAARRGRLHHGRLLWLGVWPGSWRASAADVPLALSPLGIANRPIGAAGRPVDAPDRAIAWKWEEIRQAGVAKGWLFVNDRRFCPDTGHVTAAELLTFARLPAAARERRITALLPRWLRPAHLRRRAAALRAQTALPAAFNVTVLAALVLVSIYVLSDGPNRLPAATAHVVAERLPFLLVGVFALHLGAVALAAQAVRRMKTKPKPAAVDRRGAALWSALLLPAQALRLRALLGEGVFPVQHPLALALAFGRREAQKKAALQTLADLRWPLGGENDPPLAREIGGWFRIAWEQQVRCGLRTAGLDAEALLAPPPRNAATSCQYCPRCGDQFVAGRATCPQGVPLVPFDSSVS